MDAAILSGLFTIAVALWSGLFRIAEAIEKRRVDVNFSGPIRIESEVRNGPSA